MKNKIPSEVDLIINKLNTNGFLAYIVGGCVRDLLIGRPPKDWDIVTSATPDKVATLFEKTIPTGVKYGTITVVLNDTNFEVTTFRNNEVYTNHRKPDKVDFVTNLENDLERRDFTMNAIAYHKKDGVIDMFEGKKDIQNKLIKTVGDANARFEEDALRMLRAIRFASQLNFSIDETVISAIKKNAGLITKISVERIECELSKILMSEHPEKFILLHQTGLLELILPELYFGQVYIENILETSLKQIANSVHNLDIRWSILLSNVLDKVFDKFDVIPVLKDIMNRLKFSNNTQYTILLLVKYRNYTITYNQHSLKVLLSDIGLTNFENIIQFLKCTKKDFDYEKVFKTYKEILEKGEPLFLSDLDINGNDIRALGGKGEEIGYVLDGLLCHCLEYPKDNKKDTLLELAKDELHKVQDLLNNEEFNNFRQLKEVKDLANKFRILKGDVFKEDREIEEQLLSVNLEFIKEQLEKKLKATTNPAMIRKFETLLHSLNDKDVLYDLTQDIRKNFKGKIESQKNT